MPGVVGAGWEDELPAEDVNAGQGEGLEWDDDIPDQLLNEVDFEEPLPKRSRMES